MNSKIKEQSKKNTSCEKVNETISIYSGVTKDKKKKTVAKVTDTSAYAQIKVAKRLGIDKSSITLSNVNSDSGVQDELEKALSLSVLRMNESYTGTVVCHTEKGDKYNQKKGSKLALDKAFKNMQDAATSRVKQWQKKMIRKIRNVSPETFDTALAEVVKEDTPVKEAKKASKPKKGRKRETVNRDSLVDSVKSIDETIKESSVLPKKAVARKKTVSKKASTEE